jgi:protein-S-isoprenylcysteine O-methyltransferase Ste14
MKKRRFPASTDRNRYREHRQEPGGENETRGPSDERKMEDVNLKTKNIIADIVVATFLYLLYTQLEYFRNYFSEVHYLFVRFTTLDFFHWMYIAFLVFIFPFRLIGENKKASKNLIVFRTIRRILRMSSFFRGIEWKAIGFREKTAVLSIVVRSFFFPLMIHWFFGSLENVLAYFFGGMQHITLFSSDFPRFFYNYIYWFCFHLLFLVDTAIFATAYLIDSKYLGNAIRSVEPTFFGWAVALACYPPLNNMVTGRIIPLQTGDLVNQFSSFEINFVLNIAILLAYSIFVWASVALGFKAGNLVNRGIVKSGPYRFVRHPAYTAKLSAWWIGTSPSIYFASSAKEVMFVIICLVALSFLYYFRAITEENHLSLDAEYRVYVKEVKWRFIPRLF